MNKLLVSILCNRYPRLYGSNGEASIKWSLCGDGAFSLLDVMSILIVEHDSSLFVTGIKRTRGGLVVECNKQDEYIKGVTMAVETISNYICLICGSPGTEDLNVNLDYEVIKCKKHLSHEYTAIDYWITKFECLRNKPAWSRYITILRSLLLHELDEEWDRKFNVRVNTKHEIEITLSESNDFAQAMADVIAGYCNRVDCRSGEVLRNKPPLCNLRPL